MVAVINSEAGVKTTLSRVPSSKNAIGPPSMPPTAHLGKTSARMGGGRGLLARCCAPVLAAACCPFLSRTNIGAQDGVVDKRAEPAAAAEAHVRGRLELEGGEARGRLARERESATQRERRNGEEWRGKEKQEGLCVCVCVCVCVCASSL